MVEARSISELLSSPQSTQVKPVDQSLSSTGSTEAKSISELLSFSKPTNQTEVSQSQTIIKDEDDLDTSQKWLSNAATIYQAEEGDKWQGSQKGLSDWFKDRHSKLGFDMTNMGMTAYNMSDMSDKTKQAWVDSMGVYDQTDTSLSQVGRGIFHALTDQ